MQNARKTGKNANAYKSGAKLSTLITGNGS
jgi:hypothetical protein